MIRIAVAHGRDLNAILDLYAQTIDHGHVLPRTQAVKILRRIRAYPRYDVFVAHVAARVVGAFELLIMDNLGHRGSPSGILEALAVHPDWQRRGVGTAMMRFATEMCRKSGCYKLVLSSNLERKGAHRFYESLGFKQHGVSYHLPLESARPPK